MFKMVKKSVLIFDMDGVVVDSEATYREAFYEMLAKLGINTESFDYNVIMGMSDIEIWQHIKSEFKLVQAHETLVSQWKNEKINSLKSGKLKLIDGVQKIIVWSKSQGYSIALATSSDRLIAEFVLNTFDINNLFDYSITGSEIIFGKPNPEIFLKVRDFFSVRSSECIVIEDSKNGVLAAKNADMVCIGFQSPNSLLQDLSKADFVVNEFSDYFKSIVLNLICLTNNEGH